MYGVAIGTAIASNSGKQYIDNMAMTKCAHKRPMWGRSYSNVGHKVCDHTQHRHGCAAAKPLVGKVRLAVAGKFPIIPQGYSGFVE